MLRKRGFAARFAAVFMSVLLVTALIPEFAFAEPQLVTENNVTEDDVIEKTEDMTVYQLSHGKQMKVFYTDDVRFEDENGVLTDYDPGLVDIEENESDGGEDLSGYAYENSQGDSSLYIPSYLGEDTPLLMEKDGMSASISMTDEDLSKSGITGSVTTSEESVETPYESEENLTVNATY